MNNSTGLLLFGIGIVVCCISAGFIVYGVIRVDAINSQFKNAINGNENLTIRQAESKAFEVLGIGTTGLIWGVIAVMGLLLMLIGFYISN